MRELEGLSRESGVVMDLVLHPERIISQPFRVKNMESEKLKSILVGIAYRRPSKQMPCSG